MELLIIALIILAYVSYIIYNRPKPSTFVVKSKPKDPRLWTNEQKQEYLSSPKWAILRAQTVVRDGYSCQCCGATHSLEVHHITYERLGNETPSDLVILCRSCHQLVHNKLGYSRFTLYPISSIK